MILLDNTQELLGLLVALVGIFILLVAILRFKGGNGTKVAFWSNGNKKRGGHRRTQVFTKRSKKND